MRVSDDVEQTADLDDVESVFDDSEVIRCAFSALPVFKKKRCSAEVIRTASLRQIIVF